VSALQAVLTVAAVLLSGALAALAGMLTGLRGRRVSRHSSRRTAEPVSDPSVSQEFLRTVYHELRSPVTSVAALARACGQLDQLDPSTRDEALGLIQRHAEQLTAILDDVREVADCLAARQAAVSTCSLQEVVRTSAACAGLPPHRLQIDLATNARFLSTSASALSRILTNLLQNAARYGPDGGQILVRSRRCDRSRRTEVSVLDTGCGPGPGAPPAPADALGLGSRIVDELAASLGGAVLRQRTPVGYAVAIRLPDGLVGPGTSGSSGPGRPSPGP
jgi:signal transduction histidine kinase